MGDSLRDQLLKSGLVKPTLKAKPSRHKSGGSARQGGKTSTDVRRAGDMNLAHAWAERARVESTEHKQAQAEAEARARARKELLQRLRQTLDGKALNKTDADQVRHFEYAGKIRRVHVDAAQLEALNAGRLAVVQVQGSYVVVTLEVAAAVQVFAPDHIALRVDPDAAVADDGVPDDLIW